MSLDRVLEPAPEDPSLEALAYREIDHTEVNARFVHDLITGGPVGPRVLDLGCGPAHIPILLCESFDSHGDRLRELDAAIDNWPAPDWLSEGQIEVMATDHCVEMLDLAKFEIEFASLVERVHLAQLDLTEPDAFQPEIVDTAISNSVAHHLADPSMLIQQAIRALKPGGRLFVRDLMRPESDARVEEIVAAVAAAVTDAAPDSVPPAPELPSDPLFHQQLLRQSLHAALTLEEIRAVCSGFHIAPECVVATSERHWTIDWCRP